MSKANIYNVIAKTAHYWALGPGQGIAFGQSATPVTVADAYNADKHEVTAEQLAQLKADPFLVVVDGSGAVASDDATRALQAQLKASQDDKAALKVQIAALQAKLQDAANAKAAPATTTAAVTKK